MVSLDFFLLSYNFKLNLLSSGHSEKKVYCMQINFRIFNVVTGGHLGWETFLIVYKKTPY